MKSILLCGICYVWIMGPFCCRVFWHVTVPALIKGREVRAKRGASCHQLGMSAALGNHGRSKALPFPQSRQCFFRVFFLGGVLFFCCFCLWFFLEMPPSLQQLRLLGMLFQNLSRGVFSRELEPWQTSIRPLLIMSVHIHIYIPPT